jgi:hypothetical protein
MHFTAQPDLKGRVLLIQLGLVRTQLSSPKLKDDRGFHRREDCPSLRRRDLIP